MRFSHYLDWSECRKQPGWSSWPLLRQVLPGVQGTGIPSSLYVFSSITREEFSFMSKFYSSSFSFFRDDAGVLVFIFFVCLF